MYIKQNDFCLDIDPEIILPEMENNDVTEVVMVKGEKY